jgi:hypothetical protein
MVITLGGVIDNYRGLAEVCEQRASELGISRLELDRISGLTAGDSGRLLGNGQGKAHKRLWPIGLEAILGTLGLRILLIEDPVATTRTLSMREPVKSSHQRFGNRSRLKVEQITSAIARAPEHNGVTV